MGFRIDISSLKNGGGELFWFRRANYALHHCDVPNFITVTDHLKSWAAAIKSADPHKSHRKRTDVEKGRDWALKYLDHSNSIRKWSSASTQVLPLMSSTHGDTSPPLGGVTEHGKELITCFTCTASWNSGMLNLLMKRSLVSTLEQHDTCFFRIRCGMCCTAVCCLCLSCTTHFSTGPFQPMSPSGFPLVSQPPSQLRLSIPPSFSPCLLFFLPPAQTFSQTYRQREWKIWLYPSLTLDNVQDCWQMLHHWKQGKVERDDTQAVQRLS